MCWIPVTEEGPGKCQELGDQRNLHIKRQTYWNLDHEKEIFLLEFLSTAGLLTMVLPLTKTHE